MNSPAITPQARDPRDPAQGKFHSTTRFYGFVEILTLFFSTLLGATARNASAPAAVASL